MLLGRGIESDGISVPNNGEVNVGKVLTVMNMKGGVGKTTVSANIAAASAAFIMKNANPLKVLIIDYDPQFNLSQVFLDSKKYFQLEEKKKTILSVLLENDTELNPYKLQVPGNETPPSVKDLATKVFSYKNGSSLDIVPSTLDLMYVALGQADTQLKPIENRFQKFIAECKELYDLVIIDCHPAGSLFTKTSLRNSDAVLIPVMPQRYAVRGIGLMMNFIASKKLGVIGPTPYILFNATKRIGISQEETKIRANPNFSGHCLTHTLKHYAAFAEPEDGKGFAWQSKKAYSTEACRNLVAVVRELHEKIGIRQK